MGGEERVGGEWEGRRVGGEGGGEWEWRGGEESGRGGEKSGRPLYHIMQ
jgi:hypothetical protein